jgi:hypothetical protein
MGDEIKSDFPGTNIQDISNKFSKELIKHKIKIILLIIIIVIGIISIFYLFYYFTNKNPIDFNNLANETREQLNINKTKPSTIPTPKTTKCIENWSCADWQKCENNLQLRPCSDSNKCGTNTTRPPFKKDCCNWTCESWSECYPSRYQYRRCTIEENCPKDDTPDTKKFCNYTSPCKDTEGFGIINYSKKGIVTDRSGVKWEDNCKDNRYLIEFFCDKYGNTVSREHQCNIECYDGACINETIS